MMDKPNVKLTAECSIMVDDKRSIWIELSADGPEPEAIAGALAKAVSDAALEVYARTGARRAEGGRESTPRPAPRLPRRDPTDLRGMGELDDDKPSDPEAARIVSKVEEQA